MEWIEPKTDWSSVDSLENRFDYTSYNRIKNNIAYLAQMAEALKFLFTVQDMGADKTYSSYGFYADEINAFSKNLDAINDSGCNLDIGQSLTYYDNGGFIGYEDLNRIESACIKLKDKLAYEREKEWTLPIKLSANNRIGVMF